MPDDTLSLAKDQIDVLRLLDISLVAEKLDYLGVVQPKENAIDLVRRIRSCDFPQAIAWLHREIDSVPNGFPMARTSPPQRTLTPAENLVTRAIVRQTDALGCNRYRITLVPSDEGKKPFLPGKTDGADSEEKFYTRSDIKNIVPWLLFRNNQGDNVFVTPMDDYAYYILLDDVRASEEELERKGFQPCLVQKTSWDNKQVVFKVPKRLNRDCVMDVFNQLNKTMGDRKISALRHPFRLAGFRNRKPKHMRDGLYPFVDVSFSSNRFCTRCTELVEQEMALRELSHTSLFKATLIQFW